MKHIVIIDDKIKQNKALNGIKILTAAQWEAVEDKFIADEIKKGLKSGMATKAEVNKTLQKMRA